VAASTSFINSGSCQSEQNSKILDNAWHQSEYLLSKPLNPKSGLRGPLSRQRGQEPACSMPWLYGLTGFVLGLRYP
jgi:hypothetical protein